MDDIYDEMSDAFKKAFGYSNSEHYRLSIPLYEKALSEDKHNFAALNNLAVAKIFVGIEEKNKDLIQNAIVHLKQAISITMDVYGATDGYPIAENNLAWAEKELLKLI